MHILTIANKKQTQKLKQDKQKLLEKESGREGLSRQNGVFWDCFFLFSTCFFTQPWDHTPMKSPR